MLVDMIDNIQAKLQYRFRNPKILEESLTHRSYVNENREDGTSHNERLELLGDAVLGLIVTTHLFETMPGAVEGELSQVRSTLVDAKQCAKYVEKLGIGDALRLGKGEKKNLGRGRESIHADLFEAIIGAIFLDGGYEAAKLFFFSHFAGDLDVKPDENYKAQFQDFVQKELGEQPSYVVEKESGPDHDKVFCVAVFVGEKKWGSGVGPSKKVAEQEAAKDALRKV